MKANGLVDTYETKVQKAIYTISGDKYKIANDLIDFASEPMYWEGPKAREADRRHETLDRRKRESRQNHIKWVESMTFLSGSDRDVLMRLAKMNAYQFEEIIMKRRRQFCWLG